MSSQAGLVREGFGTVGALEGFDPVVHIHMALIVVLHGEAAATQLTPEPGIVAVLFAHVHCQPPLCFVVKTCLLYTSPSPRDDY